MKEIRSGCAGSSCCAFDRVAIEISKYAAILRDRLHLCCGAAVLEEELRASKPNRVNGNRTAPKEVPI